MCASKIHINNPIIEKPHHVVYKLSFELVGNTDSDICGKDSCTHFRKDHKDGKCIICQGRIKQSTAQEIAKDIACTSFEDQTKWTDFDKFWKIFDKACSFNIPKELKKGELPAMYAKIFAIEQLCENRWRWKPAKTSNIVSALIDDERVKVVNTRLYDVDAPKFEKCIVRLSQI